MSTTNAHVAFTKQMESFYIPKKSDSSEHEWVQFTLYHQAQGPPKLTEKRPDNPEIRISKSKLAQHLKYTLASLLWAFWNWDFNSKHECIFGK